MQVANTESSLEQLMQELTDHNLYEGLKTLEDVKTFTEYHVFAVWDFMSLLKALQIKLTCTKTPWIPYQNSQTAYLINEIVIAEETDINQITNVTSEKEMAMVIK